MVFPGKESCDFQGYAPAPDDCTAYLHCTGGLLYRYQCGMTAMFDAQTETCVAPATSDHQCDKVKNLPKMQPLGR